jgi:RNA polymerase sigma-70 factor (ECF subfamily)
MSPAKVSETTLAAARARDPDAIASIYLAYAPELYRFARAGLHNKETAEDLVGGVFVSVIEALPGFRGPVEALAGWLFQIARHDLADHRRSASRHPVEPLHTLDEITKAGPVEDPEDLAVTRLEGGRLWSVVGRLPESQRDVLLLRLAAGLSTPEVARAVGRSVGAVKALQHRGLVTLAQHADDGGPSAGHTQNRGRR